jgi:hypothetical protein
VSIRPQRNTKRPRQTEIRQLEVALLVNQQVLRLEIAVQDAVRVAVLHAADQLVHEALHHILAEPHTRGDSFHVLLKIQVEEFEDQVHLVALRNDVKELHDVRIVHLFEQTDLADGSARDTLVFCFETDLLHRYDPVVVVQVLRLVHDSVRAYTGVSRGSRDRKERRTLADLLDTLVAVHGCWSGGG